jgi:hypothetical protein
MCVFSMLKRPSIASTHVSAIVFSHTLLQESARAAFAGNRYRVSAIDGRRERVAYSGRRFLRLAFSRSVIVCLV